MDPEVYPWVFPAAVEEGLRNRMDLVGPPMSAEASRGNPNGLREAEVLVTGWGGRRLDAALLDAMPALKLVLFSAGSVKWLVTPEFWSAGIAMATAADVNAVPTASFAEALVVLSLKQFWHYQRLPLKPVASHADTRTSGLSGARVGLLSLSRVGRLVAAGLRRYPIEVVAYDPVVAPSEAAALGVRLAGLEEVFATCDVVSVHTPLLPVTAGLVTGAHLRSMLRDATFINTARGAIVREGEMIEALTERGDLTALLDVTHPEPPTPESPLWRMPNVVLTPHIAGSRHRDCAELGAAMLAEFDRFRDGQPMVSALTRELVDIQA
jgi:phosphoglycerate dehydrogenase-like enzyme